MAAAEALVAPPPAPTREAEEAGDAGEPPPGAVHFPLEGGPPRVRTAVDDVAPGVSKQVMARGRDEPPPLRDDKCFGAPHPRDERTAAAHATPPRHRERVAAARGADSL
jgi:hypothetical protein